MRKLILFLFALIGLVAPLHAQNTRLFVVVNAKNPIASLSEKEAVNLFLGRSKTFANGEYALPLDHATSSAVRKRFYYDLTGKPISEINAYWARLFFSGQGTPPRIVPDNEAMLLIIRNNPGAIGYFDYEPTGRTGGSVAAVPRGTDAGLHPLWQPAACLATLAGIHELARRRNAASPGRLSLRMQR